MQKLFDKICTQIKEQNIILDHKYGYRFILCPKSTFNKNTKILFLGLNPGCSDKENDATHPSESCECGCAFFYEKWKKNAGEDDLQRQVQEMFHRLRIELNIKKDDYTFASEDILSAYFIPFRSKDIGSLINKKDSIRFANTIWSSIFDLWTPPVIICLGNDVFLNITELLKNKNYKLVDEIDIDSRWGKYKLKIASFRNNDRIITVGKLLHLSRFKIFGKKNYAPAIDEFMKILTQHIKNQ